MVSGSGGLTILCGGRGWREVCEYPPQSNTNQKSKCSKCRPRPKRSEVNVQHTGSSFSLFPLDLNGLRSLSPTLPKLRALLLLVSVPSVRDFKVSPVGRPGLAVVRVEIVVQLV